MREFLLSTLVHAHVLADGSSGDTFKVAIVTTAGVVIAAAITSYAATFQRNKGPEPPPTPPTPPTQDSDARRYARELRDRAQRAETALASEKSDRATQEQKDADEIARLEQILIKRHINPVDGEDV